MPQAIRVIDLLQELSDVEGPFVTGEFLQWDGSKFVSAAASGGGGGIPDGDVTFTGGLLVPDFSDAGGMAYGFVGHIQTGIWRQDAAAMWLRWDGTDRLGIADNLLVSNNTNFVFDTGTGSKIGTGTNQKIGFWGQTPVAQQVLATGAGATVDNVISALQSIGLFKQS